MPAPVYASHCYVVTSIVFVYCYAGACVFFALQCRRLHGFGIAMPVPALVGLRCYAGTCLCDISIRCSGTGIIILPFVQRHLHHCYEGTFELSLQGYGGTCGL